MTVKLIGLETATIEGSPLSPEYILMWRFQASASGNVTEIKWKPRESGHGKFAIYADDAGAPTTLLNQTAEFDMTADIVNTISIPSTAVVSGAYYWLATMQEGITQGYYYTSSSSGTYKYKALAYATGFPSPAGTGYGSLTYDAYIAGWGTPPFDTYTKTYTADALFQKLGLTKTIDADTLLKKLAILQTVDVDALLQKGFTRTFLAKAILGAANIAELTADVLLKAFGLTQTLHVDALLQQQDITETVDVDAIIKLIATQTLDVDAILKAIKTATFTADVRLGEMGVTVFTASVYFRRLAYHVILDAQYITETPEANRVYVIGSDAEGNPVYGTDLEQSEIDLVGERLDFTLALSIPTSSLAADVADAMLKKQRLSKHRGFITIPPNAGAELWDVIQLTDKPCAQSSSSYRVVAITFDYHPRQRRYQHKLFLAAR